MTNGSNNFGVPFSLISWISKRIAIHPSVAAVTRSHDIQFDIDRKLGDSVRLICLDEYTCGISRIFEVLEAFPQANIIYVGGDWNRYTLQAKEFCLEARIGLYNTGEITSALFRRDYWNYHRSDKFGNPEYSIRKL